MDELETTQTEDRLDAGDAAGAVEAVEVEEATEAQSLDDATHEPGTVIEETGTFEQSEAVVEALVEAMENTVESQIATGPYPGDTAPPPSAEDVGEPGPASVVEVPEAVEIKPAGDADQADTIGRDDEGRIEDPELSESEDDEDDLPGGEDIEVGFTDFILQDEDPAPPLESADFEAAENQITLDHTGPGGNVAIEEDDYGGAGPKEQLGEIPEPGPDPFPKPAGDDPGLSPGVDGKTPGVAGTPHGPGGPPDPPPPPPPPDQNRHSGEGQDDGGEATPINLPEMPDDDNEATPIN